MAAETLSPTKAPLESSTQSTTQQQRRRSPTLAEIARPTIPQVEVEEDARDTIIVAGTFVSSQSLLDEQPVATPGRPSVDPIASLREPTRLSNNPLHRDTHRLPRVQPTIQQDERLQEPPLVVEFSALALRDDPIVSDSESAPEPRFDAISLPSPPTALSSRASEGALPDIESASQPPTPAPSLNATRQDNPPSEFGGSPASAASSPSLSGPSSPSTPQASSSNSPVLNSFLQAIHDQETAGGADFLRAQSDVYDQVFQTFFRFECGCKSLLTPTIR